MGPADQQAFFASYEHTCLAEDAHDVDWTNAWYDFAPSNPNCKIADDDVIRPIANVSAGEANTNPSTRCRSVCRGAAHSSK